MVRPVEITFVANGYSVKVGCQTFVFTDSELLLMHLREYMHDPEAKTKSMQEHSRNMKWTNDGCLTPAASAGCGTPIDNRGGLSEPEYQRLRHQLDRSVNTYGIGAQCNNG